MSKINIVKDLLVSLKNGYSRRNKFAYCRVNSLCLEVLWVLYREELIYDFIVNETKDHVKIRLKYFKDKPLLDNLQLVTKPTLDYFVKYKKLNNFYKVYDYFFMSTPSGIISSRNLNKKVKSGGLILFGLKLYT